MLEPGGLEDGFFLRLFEASPHPYLILGAVPSFPILAVNDRYLEATGTQRSAIIGHGLFEIFPDNPEDGGSSSVSDLRTSLGRVMSDQKPDTMGVQKYDIPLRDGRGGFEVRYWSPVNTPVFDGAGRVAWIIHHVEDVTEFMLQKERLTQAEAGDPDRIRGGRERMEAEVMHRSTEVKDANRALKTALEELERNREELSSLNARLSEMDRLKSDFFANISHELRTPLTLILGPLGHRLRESGLDADLRSDLERMERNARILLARVNDLLDLAKLDAGRMGLHRDNVDLAFLVRLESARFESLAQVRNITFAIEAPGHLPACVDPEKVRRILANLLSNAFKFTPPGGRIQVLLAAAAGQGTLAVEDSGPGIPEPMKELIFDRFRQVEEGPGRHQGGTGLGLAIVKEFTELHGGRVAAMASAFGGALFQVMLPLQPQEGGILPTGDVKDNAAVPELLHWEPSAALDSLKGPTAAAATILVVEDNGDMRDFLAKTLARTYHVVTAIDGDSGLRQALAVLPDLLISDVMMPGMTGDVLVQELRRHPETEDLPIILLTAKADEALRVKMLRLGVGDYLFKPFSFDELLARVAALLESRQKGRIASLLQESRFQAMFEQASVGMAQIDLHGTLLRVNHRLGGFLGYSPDELVGRRFQDLTYLPDLEADLQQLEELAEGSAHSRAREKRYIRKDGSLTWGNRTVSLVRDPVGGSEYIFVVVEDINTRKDAEQTLQRLRVDLEVRVKERTAELQSANQELDTFAYTASHDLRAPLRAMGGFSQALIEDLGPRLAEKERHNLNQIILSSARMAGLIDGLLQLSRIARGELKREWVDLSALANLIRGELERCDPSRPATWEVAHDLKAWGDRQLLEVLLRNLLGNAWKYTAGTATARIGLLGDSSTHRFQVVDNGAGFEMAYAGKLFQPFQRLHRQDEFPGSGIGLATVFRIIQRHGGTIEAQAKPGLGARFLFTLPGPDGPES